MKVRFFLSLILSQFFVAELVSQQSLLFDSEYIDFKIDSNFFSINGVYVFKNVSSNIIIQSILFPIACECKKIDTIRVIDIQKNRNMYFERQKEAIRFDIVLLAHDSLYVNIFYRQPTLERNKYILTTANLWSKPIRNAFYSLSITNNLKVKSVSLKQDSINYFDGRSIYYWSKFNFSPVTDFEVILEK